MSDLSTPYLVAIGLGLLGIGAYIGSLPSLSSPSSKKASKKSWPNSYDVTVHRGSSDEEDDTDADSEEDSEDEGDGKELKDFSDTKEEVKLVLVVRTDLGMGKGKIAAQASHATLACYKYLASHPPSLSLLKRWESHGQPKIALQAKSEDDLLLLQAQAVSLGLCAKTITDAGRTQIAANTMTVLGVLGPKGVVDQVTGHLKLL